VQNAVLIHARVSIRVYVRLGGDPGHRKVALSRLHLELDFTTAGAAATNSNAFSSHLKPKGSLALFKALLSLGVRK
jgi:hypothetical protein